MDEYLYSQIAATLSIIFGLVIPFLFDSRKFILLCKILSGLCWMVHHYLLGTPSASLNALIGLIVTLFCYFRLSLPFNNSKVYPGIFIGSSGVMTIIAYSGISSIFAYLGSTLNMLARWQLTTKKMRITFLLAALPWILYCIADKTVMGLLANILSVIILSVAIYRFDIKK